MTHILLIIIINNRFQLFPKYRCAHEYIIVRYRRIKNIFQQSSNIFKIPNIKKNYNYKIIHTFYLWLGCLG